MKKKVETFEEARKHMLDDIAGKPNLNSEFEKELTNLINRYSKENDSDTPDYILASYISDCLNSFTVATRMRDKWFGYSPWSRKTNATAVPEVVIVSASDK